MRGREPVVDEGVHVPAERDDAGFGARPALGRERIGERLFGPGEKARELAPRVEREAEEATDQPEGEVGRVVGEEVARGRARPPRRATRARARTSPADRLDVAGRECARHEAPQACVLVAVDHVHRAAAPLVERPVGEAEPLERAEAQLCEAGVGCHGVQIVGREQDRLAGGGDRGAVLLARCPPLRVRVLPEVGVAEVDGVREAHAAQVWTACDYSADATPPGTRYRYPKPRTTSMVLSGAPASASLARNRRIVCFTRSERWPRGRARLPRARSPRSSTWSG